MGRDTGEVLGANDPGIQAGWAASGTLIPANTSKILSLQRQFKRPGMYVVQFSMERPNPQNPAVTVVSAEAFIEWAVAGNTTTRRISLLPGCSIAGNAESVRVVVRDISAPAVFPDVIAEEYRVGILVTPGVRADVQQPPQLISGVNQTSILNGALASFNVPQDAGVISVHVDVASVAGAAILDQGIKVDHVSDTVASFVLKSYEPRDCVWCPLAPGTRVVRVHNRSGATFVCRVTFGIDG
jgi:hypothetical protein